MQSEEGIQGGTSNPDPELWTDSTLVTLSLRNLSKVLSEKLSQQRVLGTYFRWLEMHRVFHTPITDPWEVTLADWAKSLRARGLSQKELMKEVEIWKEKNGPFRSPYRRYPPMPYDIAKAWPENIYVPPERSTAKRDFSGEPPGDYICNRCNKRGHFLEACPTNTNPAFDKPPNMNYCCPVCKEWGKHYKSLCPKNKDPYSITQKRRMAGITATVDIDFAVLRDRHWEKTAGQNLEKDDSSEDHIRIRSGGADSGSTFCASPDYTPPDAIPAEPAPKYTDLASRNTDEAFQDLVGINDTERNIQQFDEIGTDDVAVIRNNVEFSRKRVRVASPDPAKTLSRRLMNEKSPSPTKARILRNKIAAIEAAERREGLLPMIEPGARNNYTMEKASLLAELYEEEHGGRMGREYDADNKKRVLDDDSAALAASHDAADAERGYAPSTKRSRLVYRPAKSPTMDKGGDMDVDLKKPVSQKAKIITYDDFIQKLINCRPEMKETVHQTIRRPTALDMWNDDHCKFKMMSISSDDDSPPKAAMSPFHDELDGRAEDFQGPMDESVGEYDPAKTFDAPASFYNNEEDLMKFSPTEEEDTLIELS